MNKETITGFIGKYNLEKNFRFFEDSKNSVINLTICDNKKNWHNIVAWNDNALKLKSAIEEGYKKFTLRGTFKEKEYVNKQGNTVKGTYLQVSDLQKRMFLEKEGNIAKIDSSQTPKGKKYTSIMLVNNQDQTNKEIYNLAVWEGSNIKTDDLNVGDKIKFFGEAIIFDFEKDGKSQQSITVQVGDLTKDLDKELSKPKEEAISKEEKPVKSKAPAKSKDNEISM